MKTPIDEQTTITLSLTLMLIGGVGYVTFVAFQGNANAEAIREINVKQEKIDVIQTDIAVIKAKLEGIERKLK
jgi:hypothetical protein